MSAQGLASVDLFGGDSSSSSSSDASAGDGDGGEHGNDDDNSGSEDEREEPIQNGQDAIPVAPGRALFVRAVSDATTEEEYGGAAGGGAGGHGMGKNDNAPAAGSRQVKTLPRPTYERDPRALIKVCNDGGTAEEVRDIIARGIDIDEQDGSQRTALHYAAASIHYAAARGFIDIVRELIRAGAALDVQDEDGVTARQLAQQYGRADIVARLEEAEAAVAAAGAVNVGDDGASVPEAAEGKDDAPPAAAAGSSRPVKTLPRPAYEGDPEALIKVCDYGGSGNVEEARGLIARGINIDEQDEDGATALHFAAMYGYIDIVQELIRVGAALDVEDEEGDTALHNASEEGLIDIVRELVRAGAALDVPNWCGRTALQVKRN